LFEKANNKIKQLGMHTKVSKQLTAQLNNTGDLMVAACRLVVSCTESNACCATCIPMLEAEQHNHWADVQMQMQHKTGFALKSRSRA
jgi:hypothetical protein